MPSFKEWLLLESPMSVIDDWDGEELVLDHISMKVLPKYWEELSVSSDDKTLKVYMGVDKDTAILGRVSDKQKGYLKILTELTFKFYTKLGELRGNIIAIKGVKTAEKKLRGKGYGRALDQTLLDNGYDILSDGIQYNGARQLYQKIYDFKQYKIDIYDEKEKELITNVVLKHGTDDEDIDTEHWSLDTSKMNLKFYIHK